MLKKRGKEMLNADAKSAATKETLQFFNVRCMTVFF
jgi:hypothetical protein